METIKWFTSDWKITVYQQWITQLLCNFSDRHFNFPKLNSLESLPLTLFLNVNAFHNGAWPKLPTGKLWHSMTAEGSYYRHSDTGQMKEDYLIKKPSLFNKYINKCDSSQSFTTENKWNIGPILNMHEFFLRLIDMLPRVSHDNDRGDISFLNWI